MLLSGSNAFTYYEILPIDQLTKRPITSNLHPRHHYPSNIWSSKLFTLIGLFGEPANRV